MTRTSPERECCKNVVDLIERAANPDEDVSLDQVTVRGPELLVTTPDSAAWTVRMSRRDAIITHSGYRLQPAKRDARRLRKVFAKAHQQVAARHQAATKSRRLEVVNGGSSQAPTDLASRRASGD